MTPARASALRFAAQRLSAVVLAACVVVHLVTIVYASRHGLSATTLLQRFRAHAAWPAFYAVFVVAVTIHAVFPHLDVYPAEGNVVMAAYQGEALSQEDLLRTAEQRQNKFGLRYDLAQLLAQRRELNLSDENAIDKNAKLLTDDFAPVETLKAIERKNRKWPDR